MKATLINEICDLMKAHLTDEQNNLLRMNLQKVFRQFNIPDSSPSLSEQAQQVNMKLLNLFIAAKRIEGCSENTLQYYSSTLLKMINSIQKNVCEIETDDIRFYLCRYQEMRNSGKVTIDNIRRIMSSFFIWLEDEDYISKSPVRRIHKVKTTQFVKETLTDENLESLRDQCRHPRDLAIIDLLISTGIRVGELVNLNRSDIDFNSRECIVLGKGDKERRVCFDAKTKSISSSISQNGRTRTVRFSSGSTLPGTACRSPVWSGFCPSSAAPPMSTTSIRTNSGGPWPLWRLKKACLSNSSRNFWAIHR